MFDRVQALLASHQSARRTREKVTTPLAGKLFDGHGNRLTPTHSRGARGTSYRYYVPSRCQQGARRCGDQLSRFPARRVDAIIGHALARVTPASIDGYALLHRAEISEHAVELLLPARTMTKVRSALSAGESVEEDAADPAKIRWTIPALVRTRGGRPKVEPVIRNAPNRDPVLIKGLRAAHAFVRRDLKGLPMVDAIPASRYSARLMRLAFLSPSIQQAILDGRQPPRLRLDDLVRAAIPACWKNQERLIASLAANGRSPVPAA